MFLAFFQGMTIASAYEIKVNTVEGYSKPWILIHANGAKISDLKEGRIHFHGWTQDPATGAPYNDQYDFPWTDSSKTPEISDLKKFVDAYGMGVEVEKNPGRAILIPLSRGHNDEYGELLELNVFAKVFSKVLWSFSINEHQFKLISVSAHSGGGSTLSRLLSDDGMNGVFGSVGVVRLYDAIYSVETVNNIELWIKNNHHRFKVIKLFSIPGQSPAKYGEMLYSSSGSGETIHVTDIEGVLFNQKSKFLAGGGWLQTIQEQRAPFRFNHWSLVTQFWNF